jgi:hypothetical protein
MLANPDRVPIRRSFAGTDRASPQPLLVGRGDQPLGNP